MRIKHSAKSSFIQGNISEESAIRDWIWRARQYEPSLQIMADECDEYESSFTVAFQLAKNARFM